MTARGNGPCMDCGGPNPFVWFTDNSLWNLVIGGSTATDDPGGLLCPSCFVARAEMVIPSITGWQLVARGVGLTSADIEAILLDTELGQRIADSIPETKWGRPA